MELLLMAVIGLAHTLITEAAKKLGWKTEHVLVATVLLLGVGIAGYQKLYGEVAFQEVAEFTTQAFAFSTAIYLLFLRPLKKKLNK